MLMLMRGVTCGTLRLDAEMFSGLTDHIWFGGLFYVVDITLRAYGIHARFTRIITPYQWLNH